MGRVTHSWALVDDRPGAAVRRVVGAACSLLVPGSGHFFLGRWRRALFWFTLRVATLSLVGLWPVEGLALLVGSTVATVADLLSVAPSPRGLPAWGDGLFQSALLLGGFLLIFRVGIMGHVIEPYSIPGRSMSPTVVQGDYIAVTKLGAAGRSPRRGDVVVFRAPNQPATFYLKRVIALAGDAVSVHDGVPYLGGEAVPRRRWAERDGELCRPAVHGVADGHPCEVYEERLGHHRYGIIQAGHSQLLSVPSAGAGCPPHTTPRGDACVVDEGHFFVLGDNRQNSLDSRVFGAVPVSAIVGRARRMWWSAHDGVNWGRIGAEIR